MAVSAFGLSNSWRGAIWLAAAALIVTLPVLIITIFVQRQIEVGVTASAVKG